MNLTGKAADLATPLQGDEKTWAIVAALSSLVCCAFVGPLVIYFIKKDQSPNVGKIALHAAAFAGGIMVVMIVLQVITSILSIVGGAVLGNAGSLLGCLGSALILVLFLYYLIIVIMATITVSKGDKYFLYPITSGFLK